MLDTIINWRYKNLDLKKRYRFLIKNKENFKLKLEGICQWVSEYHYLQDNEARVFSFQEPQSIVQNCDDENWRVINLSPWSIVKNSDYLADVSLIPITNNCVTLSIYIESKDLISGNKILHFGYYHLKTNNIIIIDYDYGYCMSERELSSLQTLSSFAIIKSDLNFTMLPNSLQQKINNFKFLFNHRDSVII